MLELLVVVGIMMALSAVLLAGISRVRKSAANAKAQDLVSNAATALNQVLQLDKNWPGYLIKAASASDPMLDSDACQALIRKKVFSLSYVRDHDSDGDTFYRLTGPDRCGIVDPWTAQFLKRLDPSISGNSALSRKVPGGGTVRDHVLRFAIDDNYDGFCNARVGGTTLRIRASAVVWSCGQNGVFEDYSKVGRVEGSDDLYSWTPGQVER
jgi:type II secretory pathway pseudopilin PulG